MRWRCYLTYFLFLEARQDLTLISSNVNSGGFRLIRLTDLLNLRFVADDLGR